MKVISAFLLCFLVVTLQQRSTAVEYDAIKIIVEDQAITRNEIEIRAYELAQTRTGRQPSSATVGDYKKEAINQLVEESLLDTKADELMILIDEEELDEEIIRFQKQRNISQIEFEELLDRQNINLADFRKTYRRQLRRNRVVSREIRAKINIDEAVLKSNYEATAGAERLVRARHILLMVGKDASDEKVDQVKQKALQLRKKIETGEPFATVAEQYSEDPSVKNNQGDLGFFKQGDMVKEFSEAAFALEKGVVSEPIRSPFGFHLIEVIDAKTEPKESFETVKNKLMQQEYQKQFSAMYLEYMATLKAGANITFK